MPHTTFEVRPYQAKLKTAWDDLVRRAKNSNFLFLRDYMNYHGDRFEDHSLMFYRDGRLVGCLPANVEQGTLHSHQGLTYGGLLMHPEIRLEQVRSIMSSLVDHLRDTKLKDLLYRPMPHIYHQLPAEDDLVALSDLQATIIASKAICVVRTDGGNKFSRNRKRDVRRFHKSGLQVRRSYDFIDFMALCETSMNERFATTPIHSSSAMQGLANKFPDHIKLYAAYDNAQMIAGVIVYCNPACAKLQYMAYSDAGRQTGAIAAIYCHILEQVLPKNTWLEFGHSVTPVNGFNKGVHNYKESFGAQVIESRSYLLTPDTPGAAH